MATINQTFKSGQEYVFSISQIPEISTDTAVINFVGDTSGNLTARKISDTVFGLTYNGSSKTFTSNIQLVINGVSGYAEGLIIYIDINGTLVKEPVKIYNPASYTISVDIYRYGEYAPTLDIYYCVGKTEGTYTHYTNSTDYGNKPAKSISVGAKQSVWIYSDTMTTWGLNSEHYIHIKTPDYSDIDNIKISGNIMSLIIGDLQANSFINLFKAFRTLRTVSKNFLPATTLTTGCYSGMFYNCKSLVTAPNLPATTSENYCYYQMFQGCSSLATAPELLPATTLKVNCYQNMFYGCSSLVTAPILPATTLVNNCYDHMFYGCSKLNYIKALFTTTPSDSYTQYWVNGVASTGKFVKNHNATWDVTGPNGIPSGWTVITELEDYNEN